MNAELPKQISSTATLTAVSFHWQESNSILVGGDWKEWNETYELSIDPNQESLTEEKTKIISHICQSELHRNILDLGIKIGVRMIVPHTYHFKDATISKASCAGIT